MLIKLPKNKNNNVKHDLAKLFDESCDEYASMNYNKWLSMPKRLCIRLGWNPTNTVRMLKQLECTSYTKIQYQTYLQEIFNSLPPEREVFSFAYEINDFVMITPLTQATTQYDVRSGIIPAEHVDTSVKLSCNAEHVDQLTINPCLEKRGVETTVRDQSYAKWYSINNYKTISLPKLVGQSWNLLSKVFSFTQCGESHIKTIELKQTTLAELSSKCSPLKSVSENYATLTSWKTNQALQIDPLLAEDTIRWALIYFYSEMNVQISEKDIIPLKQ